MLKLNSNEVFLQLQHSKYFIDFIKLVENYQINK